MAEPHSELFLHYVRYWFFREGWLMPALLALWFIASRASMSTFLFVRRKQLGVGRISRFFTIKLEAAEFLVKWLLLLSLFVVEAYLLYNFFLTFSPAVARHSDVIRLWMHNLRRIGIILICIITARKLSSVFAEAVLTRVSSDSRSTSRERELRIKTLVGALNGAINAVLVLTGILLIFWQIDNRNLLAPLVTGAGLIGVVVAFGAQSLMRDFFTGFFILLENQYKIGDVVRIGDRAGAIERVSLRITTMRDEHGSLHIIPNGEIKSVTNMSFGWAQAVVDFPIPYSHKPEIVRAILEQEALALRRDEDFTYSILSEPVVLGIEATAFNSVTYRVSFRTRAFDQWNVAREYRRRVLNSFSESGIAFLPPVPATIPVLPPSSN
jgi:small conductance mechanosensitive channel